jgi:hypothetical protein
LIPCVYDEAKKTPFHPVTVLLYVNKRVKVNYAFKKGDLKGQEIDKIVADLSKILPAKGG